MAGGQWPVVSGPWSVGKFEEPVFSLSSLLIAFFQLFFILKHDRRIYLADHVLMVVSQLVGPASLHFPIPPRL